MAEHPIDIDFGDLEPILKTVRVQGKPYLLREASGDAATKYRAAQIRGAEIVHNDDRGERTVKRVENVAEVEPLLVSLCLYVPDDAGKLRTTSNGLPNPEFLVPASVIKSWPAKVQKTLFEAIKEMSDLDESDKIEDLLKQRNRLDQRIARLKAKEDEAKNSDCATAAGSA